jgi:Prolyl oligopeptidase family
MHLGAKGTTGARPIKEEIMRTLASLLIAALAAVLAACNDGTGGSSATFNGSPARGELMWNPPLRIATLTATDFATQLNATPAGQQLVQVTGAPTCGVDFYYIQYGTVDGGQTQALTNASGALMVPTGATPVCSGPRPILLYAHATQVNRAANMADITDPNNVEGALIAAMFAAQGYIVVAPNYAGYDSSPLPYHPFLNADQQSKEMIDSLTAARKALGGVFASGTTDNGKLFISGYSQGGHVAMATMRAMQAASIAYTAAAPMSGPYALEATGDAIFSGQVNLGSTVFGPLLSTSYQRAYGNFYQTPTDASNIYAAPYAATIDAILPSNTPLATLFQQGKLPQTAAFSSTPPTTNGVIPPLDAFFVANTPPTTPPAQAPLFALGFAATGFLTQNSWRLAYVEDAFGNPDGALTTPPTAGVPRAAVPPTQPARLALYTNDLRTAWAPNKATLLCGGNADPTIYFSVNTLTMQAFWAALPPGAITVLDVDSAPTGPSDPFAAAKVGFATAKAAAFAAGGQNTVIQEYHGTLVPPFCAAAARGFFSQF